MNLVPGTSPIISYLFSAYDLFKDVQYQAIDVSKVGRSDTDLNAALHRA